MINVPFVANSPKISVPASMVSTAGASTNTAPRSTQNLSASNVVSVVIRPRTTQTSRSMPVTVRQSIVAWV